MSERSLESETEIGFRLDAGELGTLQQRIEERRHLRSAQRARAVVVLPPDDDAAQANQLTSMANGSKCVPVPRTAS